MTLPRSWSKMPICMLHRPPLRTKLLYASLYDEPFSSYGPILGTRGPWTLTLCLRTNFAIGQSFRSDFQNNHIWASNLAIRQSSRSCLHIYPLSTPGGWNGAYFRSTGSGFRDMGWFLKLSYLGMKLGQWPKCQKLHIYSLSTPGDQNWPYFRSTSSRFRDTSRFSTLPYLGMKLGH